MKKICSVLLILTLILSLSACKTPMAEVESGALAETPVEEQKPTKEEQAPESKEETQEPSQEVQEETDTTQPPENTAVEEPQMEYPLLCEFKVSFQEGLPEYTLEDFSDFGIYRILTTKSQYTLLGHYTTKQEVKGLIDALYTRYKALNVRLDYEAYYVEAGTKVMYYPSLSRPYTRIGSPLQQNARDVYEGRVSFTFKYEEGEAYNHLLTLEDFPGISAEAGEFSYIDSLNTMRGYINLTDYSEAALEKAIQYIETMPNVSFVEQYVDSYSYVQ